jgi:hypothetical protein
MAIVEKHKYVVKARMTGYALNAAIGLQVIMGTLITGLSAASTNASSALTMNFIMTHPSIYRLLSRLRSLVRSMLQVDY